MKAKKSALKLLGFDVMRSHFETVFPNDDDVRHPRDCFGDYELDIDYDIPSAQELEDEVYLFIKCEVNRKKEIGYNLFVEAAARFDVVEAKEQFQDSFYDRLLVHSGLSISVNCVRNYFQSISVMAPFAEYLLPAIDVLHLIDSKTKSEENEEEE